MDKYKLSYFERSIFVAFCVFSDSNADFNIIEVGLGGTFDATNVIDCKKICVITSIGVDHCAILGETIDKIAANKFGIINKGDDVIIGYQKKDFGIAGLIGGKDWFVDKTLKIGLLGDHQYYNAGNAIAVANLIGINDAIIKKGLINVKWLARLQKQDNFIIDGAHNLDGINSLCDYLDTIDEKKIGIMAIMCDKDIISISKRLKGVFNIIYCVDISDISMNRALSADSLCDILKNNDINSVVGGSVCDVLNMDFMNDDKRIVFFGSFFLSGEVLKALKIQ